MFDVVMEYTLSTDIGNFMLASLFAKDCGITMEELTASIEVLTQTGTGL